MHGHGGEWRVEPQRLRWEILEAFRDAAAEQGIGACDDFNRGDNFGCGYFEVNQRRGIRWNAAKAFLRTAIERNNLTVLSGAHVERLRLSQDGSKRVLGVEYRDSNGGETVVSLAKREVVLAAGAVGTPQILELSGIGDPQVLAAAGVPVQVALPGVGANLQDHLQLRTVFKVRNVLTLNEQANSWFGKAKMGLEYLLFQSGPMSMSPSQLGAFARSSDEHVRANVEYHVQPLSLDKFGDPLHDFPAFTASVCNLRPTSRGSIHIRSARSEDSPAIAPNYLSTPEDRQVAADSIRLTRRIVRGKALARYSPEEFVPGPQFDTDELLAEAAGQVGTTIFHPVGTCRMGLPEDRMSVVDSQML